MFDNEEIYERLDTLSPLTLGEFLSELKGMSQDAEIRFDFGSAIPTAYDSSRGSYDELALGYELSGYDAENGQNKQMLVVDLVAKTQAAIGETFTGWKGGDFRMTEKTPIWVDNPGNWSNTAIIGVKNLGYGYVIIRTW